jgi:hypothetical protein
MGTAKSGGKNTSQTTSSSAVVMVPMSVGCAKDLYLALGGVLGFGPSPKGKKTKGKGKGSKGSKGGSSK